MALLPPFYLDSVVAIGLGEDPPNRQWVATGFVFAYLSDDDPDPGKRQYELWLITNKHVLEGLKSVFIKLNAANATDSTDYKVELMSRNGDAPINYGLTTI